MKAEIIIISQIITTEHELFCYLRTTKVGANPSQTRQAASKSDNKTQPLKIRRRGLALDKGWGQYPTRR
jgi:hypothetical protein